MRYLVCLTLKNEDYVYRTYELSKEFDKNSYELEIPENTIAYVIAQFKNEKELQENLFFVRPNENCIGIPPFFLANAPIYVCGKKTIFNGIKGIYNKELNVFVHINDNMKLHEE